MANLALSELGERQTGWAEKLARTAETLGLSGFFVAASDTDPVRRVGSEVAPCLRELTWGMQTRSCRPTASRRDPDDTVRLQSRNALPAPSGRAPQAAAMIVPSADFTALQGAIAGEVVVPGSPGYDAARRPPITRFQEIRPQAVVRCRAAADVAQTLSLVRRSGAAMAIRSGGHCFAGRSSTTGIVIDVSPMNSVSVTDGSAVVGAGARLGQIYDALAEQGVTLPAGCGPSVGIAGLALGGGLGILGRKYGLTCDQLTGAEVVLADGRAVWCDEHHDRDLFWALRGAGGGQFGVATTLAFRTVPAPAATTLDLTWPADSLTALIAAWQAWAPDAPDELAASLLAIAPGDPARPLSIHVFGALIGTKADASGLLEDLIARAGTNPASAYLEYMPYRAAKRYLFSHGPGNAPAGPSGEHQAPPGHAYSKSEFFRRPLPADTIVALAHHLSRARRAGQDRTLDFTPWGGAYNRVPAAATAFVHRAERFLLKHEVAVDPTASTADKNEALDWLARSWMLVHPWGSGGVYPNFPDPGLDDPAAAYHGTNRERLQRVKAAYDSASFSSPGMSLIEVPQRLSVEHLVLEEDQDEAGFAMPPIVPG